MSDVWPQQCRHLAKPGAVKLEPYAVVTLKNVPAWQGKLHLEIDFECTLCPLCAAYLTHFVGGDLGRVRPELVDVYCEGCDALCVAPDGWLTVMCNACGRTMVNEVVERELEHRRKDG